MWTCGNLHGWDTPAPPPEQTPPYRLSTSTACYKEHKSRSPCRQEEGKTETGDRQEVHGQFGGSQRYERIFPAASSTTPTPTCSATTGGSSQVIVVSSDTSLDDTDVEPPPRPPIVDLNSFLETLPEIDPRPQHQLPVQPLQDLGPLNVTAELLPPPRHQTFREALVLLQQLQLPPLWTITPPPELPPRALIPPPDQTVEWDAVEVGVASFDGREYAVLVTQPLALQQLHPCQSTSQRATTSRRLCPQWIGHW